MNGVKKQFHVYSKPTRPDGPSVAEQSSRAATGTGTTSRPPSQSAKTHTQCKNKIESLKKRYRSEMAAESSSWPLYHHIDRLLRGAPANISSKSESNNKEDTVTDPINVRTEIGVNRKRKMEREDMMMGWVAEMMARNEEARMETMRETERIRMEAEEKRGELELKRTQIMADVQLQIAKLFGVYSHNLAN